jgi:hypothetical protein
MATPAVVPVAKALAPKAGQMAENYMVNQGFMPSIVAYHGTPHNIRGQFDISKVGTGEGAQTYGHGMYFAENPAVARNYMEFEGLPSLESKVPLQRQTRDFLNEYVDPNTKPSDWLKGAKEDAKANNRLDVLAELNKLKPKDLGHTAIGGNLYKVDIPDADIPLMLDWDKPLSKDAPQQLKDALNGIIKEYPDLKEPFIKAFRENKPGNHYYSLLNDYAKTGDLVKNQQFASSVLQKAGIPGIRYLDAGSRPTNVIDKRLEDLYQKHNGDIEKAADDFMRTIHDSPKKKTEIRAGIIQDLQNRPTSNFVVFDPTDVKILEKNSKPYDALEEFIKFSSK